MAWWIEFSDEAESDFARLDKEIQRRVFEYLYERITTTDDARSYDKSLQHELSGLWRYRVGDYRILCRLEDERLTVLVVEIVHRSKAYD